MFIQKWLSKQPIQKKLIYSNVIGIMIALVPVVIIMLAYEYKAIQNATLQEIRVQADIIRDSSAAAVAFQDKKAAEETLSALVGAQDMLEAHLILADGTMLAHYHKSEKENKDLEQFPVNLEQTLEIITSTTITISKPVLLRSQPVGTLILESSLNGFYNRLYWYVVCTFFATVIAFYLARWVATRISKTITEPLTYLLAATQRITTNEDYSTDSTTFSIETKDEVGSLSRAFGEMMSQINKRDLSLKQLAYYDRVTGMPNRHFFEERITQAVENATRYGSYCYLMMIDLDDFKIVNDKLGHHVGDLLLKDVGKRLAHSLRKSDSFFRIGGDEFAIILESRAGDEPIEELATKIIHALSMPTTLDGHCVKIGASIGISLFPSWAEDTRTLMSTADAAMYVAKSKGKNSFQFYNG
ncbi:sensor domain-containing diguanylate cyclase [Sulfurospirillum oryzae]|uniref:sensor domain-containing diguanylate cyclase n=1 Tax=Sulfurospirillum oryzae TaxID=2976535 RepID=UPI0021E6FA48|nr:sensor domain-containing diguanylate cyclase [Sulfurospirillum oryzae]